MKFSKRTLTSPWTLDNFLLACIVFFFLFLVFESNRAKYDENPFRSSTLKSPNKQLRTRFSRTINYQIAEWIQITELKTHVYVLEKNCNICRKYTKFFSYVSWRILRNLIQKLTKLMRIETYVKASSYPEYSRIAYSFVRLCETWKGHAQYRVTQKSEAKDFRREHGHALSTVTAHSVR